jgi:adenylate cyclase
MKDSADSADRAKELERAGLLDGVTGEEAREARVALLEHLADEGFSTQEMKTALAEGRLPLLLVDRILTGEPRYTPEEVARRAGVPLEFVLGMRQAVGVARPLPDEKVFDEQDLQTVTAFAKLLEAGLPEDGLLEVTRVLGIGLAQTAEAMRMLIARVLLEAGADERELAFRNAQAARELLPLLTPLMDHTLRLHLRDQVRNQQFGLIELSEAGPASVRQVFVGFADMVDFTRLGERIEVAALGHLVGRLSDLALESVHPPARIVKTIGDAVMFVAPSADPLLETALDLTERAASVGEDFPQLRAGIAAGPAVGREGDWYGPPVNLASRVTEIALPGAVLATEQLREAAGDRFSWSEIGPRKLKGVQGRVPLYRVRRS